MFKSYFSAKYILSKGALFNYVLSDRSDGKTFDCKARAIEAFETKGTITVYLRRYKTEITEKLYSTFFDELLDKPAYEKYRDWIFKGSKQGVQVKRNEEDNWQWIIYFVPLSMSGKMKSQLNVQKIGMIDYDEYIPLDDRYLHNEMTLLLEFWKSVDRDRDSIQLIVLGNKITPYSPFFDYFNIDMQITGEKVRLYRGGTLAVQIYANKEHRQVRSKSKFSMLVEGTEYEEYNEGGVLNALNLKVASHVGSTYFSSFKTAKGEGTVWTNGRQFIISTYQRKDGIMIVDKIYNTGREEFMISFGRFTELFKRLYRTGQLYFEDEKAYHLFEDILKKVWN